MPWQHADPISRRDFLHSLERLAAGGVVLSMTPLALAACGSDSATSTSGASGSSPKTVRIGAVVSLTGPTAAFGADARDAIKVVVDAVNSSGGIRSLGGAMLDLAVYDSAGSATTAASLTQRAISEGAVAILGCGDGTSSLGGSQAAADQGKIFLTGDPTDTMTTRGLAGVFQVTPLSATYFKEGIDALLAIASSKGQPIKSAAIAYQQITTYVGLAKIAPDYLQSKGVTVSASIPYPTTQSSFGAIASSLRSSNADLVIQFGQGADDVAIVREMKLVGFNPPAILGVIGGYLLDSFVQQLGPTADNLFAVGQFSPQLPYPSVPAVLKAWSTTLGAGKVPDAFAAVYVATTGALVSALEAAASTDTAKLMAALKQLRLKPGDPYAVLPGGIAFDDHGANTAGTGVVWQYRGGQQVPLYPPDAATGQPVFPKPPWS